MKTKFVLATVAVAVVAAALIGVAAAEFAAQTQPSPMWANSQVTQPAYGSGYGGQYCYNSTTGEPYWAQDGTVAGSGYGYGVGCPGYGEQTQNQYGYGFMGRGGYGCGGCWR